MDRILLFGGSFNPIHFGHLIIGRHVAEHLGTQRVTLIPSAAPPHKQDRRLAPAADRLAMCRAAVADDPQFEVSDWEVGSSGPNYTIHTVRHFRSAIGQSAELYWLVGMDSLHELAGWHRADQLVDECTVVTTARPGFEPPTRPVLSARFSATQVDKLYRHIVAGPHIDIAGTEIRGRVEAGQSIRYLVPEPVRQYIAERGLYRPA